MSEPRVLVTMLTGQYAGYDLRKPQSEAENLVATGQARWAMEARPQRAVETPERPDLGALSKAELVALAEKRGIKVVRADGDGAPRKADYIEALGG